jgi:hypothetical protein
MNADATQSRKAHRTNRSNTVGIKIEASSYEPIPAGVYVAQVGKVEQVEGQFGTQLKIRFDLLDPEYSDRALIGWTSCKLSPKSKLWAWSKAAVFAGREIPKGWTFDSDELLDKRLQVVVSTERGSDGETYNRITNVLPLRQRPPSTSRNAQAPAVTTRVPTEPEFPPMDWDDLADPGPTDEDEE